MHQEAPADPLLIGNLWYNNGMGKAGGLKDSVNAHTCTKEPQCRTLEKNRNAPVLRRAWATRKRWAYARHTICDQCHNVGLCRFSTFFSSLLNLFPVFHSTLHLSKRASIHIPTYIPNGREWRQSDRLGRFFPFVQLSELRESGQQAATFPVCQRYT